MNFFCMIEMTETLIVIDVVCEVSKSLGTPSKVILLFPFWHCTTQGQVIKGFDFWLRVFHHLLDRHFG